MTYFLYSQNNSAGIGDFLDRLNYGLLAAEWLQTPVVDITSKLAQRSGSTIFSFLGLDTICCKASLQRFEQLRPRILHLSLTTLWAAIRQHKSRESFLDFFDYPDLLQVTLDPSTDYNNLDSIKSAALEKGLIELKSKKLRHAISNSIAYEQAQALKTKVGRKIAVVHIRRGDIAHIHCRKLVEDGFKSNSTNSQYSQQILFALDGNYYTCEQFASHPQAYRHRHTDLFEAKFREFINTVNRNEWHICLVSDGYEKLSRRIQKDFEIPYQSEKELVRFLAQELNALEELADYSLIGESEEFLRETIIYFLAADAIIRGPGAFAGALVNFLEKSETKMISIA